MRKYNLMPNDSHKSFYGKAVVFVEDDGTEFLKSYNTIVARRNIDGTITRLWDGWSATTGRHIVAFCGLNKTAWDKMEVER